MSFGKLILKAKWLIIAVTIVLIGVSIWGIYGLLTEDKIDSDMMSYFAEDSTTAQGLTFLRENFGINGNGIIVVSGEENDTALGESVKKIREFDGITQVIWYGDILEMAGMGNLASIGGTSLITVDITDMQNFFRKKNADGSYSYVLTVTMSTSPSTSEAYALLDGIKAELSSRSLSSAGMTETAQKTLLDTLQKLPIILVTAALAVILILLLCTSSFFEPVVLLVTLGISIIVNLGTNYIFDSISIITFATSSILQLALTMDYAIFYMHAYKAKRARMDAHRATMETIPSVTASILASALTTMGGFVALYFMQYKIGADLGVVLMKGVGMSLLTVIFLQPLLVLFSDKLLSVSSHREIKLNCKPMVKFAVKKRFLIIFVIIVAIVPVYMGQKKLQFSYFQMYDAVLETPEDVMAYELGNQLILAVPVETEEGKTHSDFIEAVKSDERGRVSGVMGAFSVMKNVDGSAMTFMLDLLYPETEAERAEVRSYLETTGADADTLYSMMGQYFKKINVNGNTSWYTLYTIGISGDMEDGEAVKTYQYISKTANEYFGDYYEIGILTALSDMMEVTPRDFLVVTFVSVALIFLVIALQFRSFRKSLLLILVIEVGIWINFCISYVSGEKLNFMIYIIISSVQLGCTVDYAILMANTYEKMQWDYSRPHDASYESAANALPAIVTSAGIIVTVCMSMYLVSTNLILKQLTGMLSRGALISCALVALIQPGLMTYFRSMRSYREMFERAKTLCYKIKHRKTTKI